jgi:putative redox protein
LSSESKVELDWAEGYVFRGRDSRGNETIFDSSETGPRKGSSPMQGLLLSLGACSGMDVVAILGKRKQDLRSLKVEVSGKRPLHGHPKPFTEIHMKYLLAGKGLERKYVEEAVGDSVNKYCSVAATLSGKTKLSFSYQISEG